MGLCTPPRGSEEGSLHFLKGGRLEVDYEWRNGMWCTPGSSYGTKASAMAALGWSYLRPVPPHADEQIAGETNAEG